MINPHAINHVHDLNLKVLKIVNDHSVLNVLVDSLANEKIDPTTKVSMVAYTDGGSVTTKETKYAGCGIHGYFYVDEPTKSNSSSPRGYATPHGYTTSAPTGDNYKVKVLSYFDIMFPIGNETNNVAELMATITGFHLANLVHFLDKFTILSDSEYVIKNLQESLPKWKRGCWCGSNGKEIANLEYWKLLDALYTPVQDTVTLSWVKGHSGDIGNTRADRNATIGINMNGTDDSLFIHAYHKDFFNKDNDLSHLFTENRLVLPAQVNQGDNVYYQCSTGEYWPSVEKERREFVGKRIADTCIGVIKLKQPDLVIDELHRHMRDQLKMTGVIWGRLDLLRQGFTYNDIKQYKQYGFKRVGNDLVLPSGVELLSELNPARLSWRLVESMEQLYTLLTDYLDTIATNKPVNFEHVDITQYVYNTVDKKWVLNVPKGRDTIILENLSLFGKTQSVTLTMGIDLPSTTNMGRLAKHNPKVEFLYWRDNDNENIVYMAIVFTTEEGSGIWCSAYSNLIFL